MPLTRRRLPETKTARRGRRRTSEGRSPRRHVQRIQITAGAEKPLQALMPLVLHEEA